jgi:hypothetical protein
VPSCWCLAIDPCYLPKFYRRVLKQASSIVESAAPHRAPFSLLSISAPPEYMALFRHETRCEMRHIHASRTSRDSRPALRVASAMKTAVNVQRSLHMVSLSHDQSLISLGAAYFPDKQAKYRGCIERRSTWCSSQYSVMVKVATNPNYYDRMISPRHLGCGSKATSIRDLGTKNKKSIVRYPIHVVPLSKLRGHRIDVVPQCIEYRARSHLKAPHSYRLHPPIHVNLRNVICQGIVCL